MNPTPDPAADPSRGEAVDAGPPAPPASGEPGDAAAERWRRLAGKRAEPKPKAKRPFWVELPILILIAFGLTFLIQTFIAKVYYVPSGSMEQTLMGASSGGDRIVANKIVYDFRDPAPGDVVVFAGPQTWTVEASIPGPDTWYGKFFQALGSVVGIAPPNEKDYVKRVIAVGGQTVQCCDAAGNVTVNGMSLNEPYIYEPIEFVAGQRDCTTTPMSRRCFGPVTIPPNQIWVMGDHRSASADSSYQCQGQRPGSGAECQGPIPNENVIGKAIVIVLPPSRWATIGDPGINVAGQALGMSGAIGPTGPIGGAAVVAPAALGILGALALRGGYGVIARARRVRRRR